MENKLPSKYSDGIVSKIKRFFFGIFRKNNKEKIIENVVIKETEEIKEEVQETDIFSKMKEDSKKGHLKEDIFNIVDNNPELLNNLTISQLEEIDKLYDKKIEENAKKINKLKNKLA